MRLPRFSFAHHRLVVAAVFALALTLIAVPAAAGPTPPTLTQAQAAAAAAKKDAQNAKDAAGNADTALALARATLAAANEHLAQINTEISALQVTITTDTATLKTVNAELDADRGHLSAYLRQSYENGGSQAMLAYIISANTIAAAIQRDVQVNEISSASQQLVDRIGNEEQKASSTLALHTAALAQLAAEEEQGRTEQAIIKVQTQTLLQADITAHAQVSQAQKALAAAVAALAAARAADAVYQAIPGPLFTIDTNLTLPSGETAASLNQFLDGSALAGLGASFMQAESTYHVSARYFVAHAIL
jgi:septal ring factor EnvC (AmiA/AmiB activator)